MGVECGYTTEFAGEYTMISPAKPGTGCYEDFQRKKRALKDDLIVTDTSGVEYKQPRT